MMPQIAPLFIPLKREYYAAFNSGLKTEEFRPYGLRWNERTCWIGRSVILSLGYGRQARRVGEVIGFRIVQDVGSLPGWVACYGDRKGQAAAIRINLSQMIHSSITG